MNDIYSKNMYLSYQDLNEIENTIESLTNEIQERVFNNETSPLRNIQVGDNLNTRTLYDSFPIDLYESISGSGTNIIVTDEGKRIYYYEINYDDIGVNIYRVFLEENLTRALYYYYMNVNSDSGMIVNNGLETSLPYNMGTVTQINTNNDIYQYIKIYENEDIIPDYVKHTWQLNEPLSMQKLHNIERGIKNIGRYFYQPEGWIPAREWIIKNGNSIRTQNISYRDLNRWKHNLSLINFDSLDSLTIWNSNITKLQWNKLSDVEWEEY